VIVTDHHVALAEIPEAAAVVDPKLPGSRYASADLSGVGVALKLMQAVFRGLGRDEELVTLLDLVALGTVADMVPILGENRYLVREGLRVLNESPRPGIREMVAQANLGGRSLDSASISWALAPRLNAAGRLDHADASLQLLMTRSPEVARRLAAWLQEKNVERQELTASAVEAAREQVLAAGVGGALFAGHSEFPIGVCGLVAGRLAEEFYRPAFVVRMGDELSSGSCRSIPEFNIIDALNGFEAAGGEFIQYGGHAQAAGFTIPTRELGALSTYLSERARTLLAGLDLRPRIDIDAEVNLSDLGGDIFPLIQTLAPFGQGNPEPIFLSRRVEVLECRSMGSGGDHLRMRLRQGGTVWSAVAFGMGSHHGEVCSPLEVVYSVEVDRWNGEDRLRLNVLDFGSGH
jgi:single-stranded-DNA-specific exonuclease